MSELSGKEVLVEKKDEEPGYELPKNYIPTWEIPLALKLADLATKGGGKLIEWLRDEWPLAIQVTDSRNDQGSYVVMLRVTNMTIHGVYINSFKLTFPKVENVKLKSVSTGGIVLYGGGEEENDSTLIKSGRSRDFIIEFDTPSRAELEKGVLKRHVPMGDGKLSFLILNEESKRDKDVKFSIRIDG